MIHWIMVLINSINENLATIITNQHDNYIIKNIIMKENLILKYKIIETIIKNIVSFSNQKFLIELLKNALK